MKEPLKGAAPRLRIVDRVLEHRLADPLRDAALDLTPRSAAD